MNPDKASEYLERQQKAAGMLGSFEEEVLQLESEMLQSLVNQYNGGQLTDSSMRGFIGGIAALRALLKRIDRELTVATKEVSLTRG